MRLGRSSVKRGEGDAARGPPKARKRGDSLPVDSFPGGKSFFDSSPLSWATQIWDIESRACLETGVRALAISSRSPSQAKRFVVNAAGPQLLGLIPTRTPRGFAVSCGSRYGKAAQRSGMQDEVRSQQTNNGQQLSTGQAGSGCRSAALLWLDSDSTRPAVPRPTSMPMREPCRLAFSNAFVALRATSGTTSDAPAWAL